MPLYCPLCFWPGGFFMSEALVTTRRGTGMFWEVVLNGCVVHTDARRATVETIADNLHTALKHKKPGAVLGKVRECPRCKNDLLVSEWSHLNSLHRTYCPKPGCMGRLSAYELVTYER